VTLDSEATAEAGVLYVTVVNPEPGGGVAGPFEVEVVEGDEEGLGDTEPVVEPPGAAETAAVEAVAGPTETVEETAELDAPEDVVQDDDSK
jgi:hypothetical protein